MGFEFKKRGALAIFAGALVASGCAAAGEGKAPPQEPLEVVTDQGVRRFVVEIADTEAERERGLMFRQQMAPDQGMLFEFPNAAERSFWMKNTYLPLDIIYIGADGRIVSIARRATPFSETPIPSYGAAAGVLEINGGLAEELGIEPGDLIRHPFFKTGG
ncbi:DUF192 domain-containing protein [Caulobacter sp. 17J80-11]|uniref:DUF192 domain-containing protein n=1 Tax=Caulobacter sp. 17J80-11 TaxID=2763502 RepID=UPI0016536E75|nr:DUF192 domain-containing protein [Caulobacter sp. 17J80-11]MBC6980857.1 DUF192 domain-containing protein [Caulobacter sp. 17J80-11]